MKQPSASHLKPESRYSVEALARGLEILELFSDINPSLSLTEIVASLGLAKSTAFRMLSTLEHLGYIERDPSTKRYRPSLKILRLGFTALSGLELRQIARAHLEQLSQEVSETVSLAVIEDIKVTYVDRIRHRAIVGVVLGIGSQLPAYCTALGKVLLADLPEEDAIQRLSKNHLIALTDKTVTDIEILIKILRSVRENGYAVDDEELAIGLRAAAAPIRDISGRAVAAINVSGSVSTITLDRLQSHIVPILVRTAMEISAALGYGEKYKP